jgi:nicotinamide-nucleotide amidase
MGIGFTKTYQFVLFASGNKSQIEINSFRKFTRIAECRIRKRNHKVIELLTDKKLTISVAESCTGGELAHLITSVSGSSSYFLGSVVTYATQKKIDLLNVNPKTVEEFTVVSEQVASEMAIGCQDLFKTDISVSTTGVAGPGKGEDGKDVGTVFYTIRIGNEEVTSKLFLPHLERLDFMNFVSQKVVQDIISLLIKK